MSIGFELEAPVPLIRKQEAQDRAESAKKTFGQEMGGIWQGAAKNRKRAKVENELWKLIAVSRGHTYDRNITGRDTMTQYYYNVDHSRKMSDISKKASECLEKAKLLSSSHLTLNRPAGGDRGSIVEFVTPPYRIDQAINVAGKLNDVQTEIQGHNAHYADETGTFRSINDLKLEATAIAQVRSAWSDKPAREAAAAAMTEYNTLLSAYSENFTHVSPQATAGLSGKGVRATVNAASAGPITRHAKTDGADSGRNKATTYALEAADAIMGIAMGGLSNPEKDYVEEAATNGALNYMGALYISSNRWAGGTTTKNAIPLLPQTDESRIRAARITAGVDTAKIAAAVTETKIKAALAATHFNDSAKDLADAEFTGLKDPTGSFLGGLPFTTLGKNWLAEHLNKGIGSNSWLDIDLRGGADVGTSDLTDGASLKVGRYEIRTLSSWPVGSIAQNGEEVRQDLHGRN